jgi:hypothetical protein
MSLLRFPGFDMLWAVSLLHIRDHESQKYVFKSLPDELEYLYHEIKVLIGLKWHPNIVARPYYLVTKKSCFCGKIAGTLRDCPFLATPSDLRFYTQLRWARQLTSATIHIRVSALGFHPNL